MTTTTPATTTTEGSPNHPEDGHPSLEGCRRVDYPDGSGAYETPPPPDVYEQMAAELKKADTAAKDVDIAAYDLLTAIADEGENTIRAALELLEATARYLDHRVEHLDRHLADRIMKHAQRHWPTPTARTEEDVAAAYEEGKLDGYNEGHPTGYQEGKKEGYEEGHRAGYEEAQQGNPPPAAAQEDGQ